MLMDELQSKVKLIQLEYLNIPTTLDHQEGILLASVRADGQWAWNCGELVRRTCNLKLCSQLYTEKMWLHITKSSIAGIRIKFHRFSNVLFASVLLPLSVHPMDSKWFLADQQSINLRAMASSHAMPKCSRPTTNQAVQEAPLPLFI